MLDIVVNNYYKINGGKYILDTIDANMRNSITSF